MAYAIRATTGTVTKHSPAEVIFGRDMLIHQARMVDWNLIRERKRKQQIKDHERENRKRINHEWKIGEECLIVTKPDERTGKLLGYEHKGPYKVRKVHNNGTVDIDCSNFKETINIRRLAE